MKVDKTVLILAVVLVAVIGFFAFSNAGASVPDAGSYIGQYAGGGCAR